MKAQITRPYALLRVATLATLLLMILVLLGPNSLNAQNDRSTLKNFQHVLLIMMENTGYAALIGNPNAPFTNFAATNYGLATSYFGVTHPSQPNYIAATSGSTNGVPDDNDITINVPNIVDQLEGASKTWKAYMQSLSLCATKLDHACGNQLYERNIIHLSPIRTSRPTPRAWPTSSTSANFLLTSPTARSLIILGSALTSATTCTVVRPLPPTLATSLRCRP